MDLLDDITSMMTKTDKERPAAKGKKTTERKQQEAPAASPLSGFRIPKKAATSSHPASPAAGGASSTAGTPSSMTGSPATTPMGSFRIPKKVTPSSHPATSVMVGSSSMAERSSSMTRGSTMHRQEFEIDSKGAGDFIVPQRMKIEMNGVPIDLSRAPEYVEQYRITINKVLKNQTKDVTRGPKLSFPTEQRRRAAFSLFRQLVIENSVHFGTNDWKHVYDNGNTFYSVGCTITDEESFEMKPEELASDFAREHLRCVKLAITVKHVGKVRIKNLREDDGEGALREVCRFFEVLTSQCLYGGDSHCFGNKFFERSEERDKKLGEGKVVKSGFEKNVRLLNKDGELVPVLQIDSKKSPFYVAQPVLAFIQECAEGRNPEEALGIAKFRERVARELRGLVVVTTHLDKNRRFYIHAFSETNARNQTFETTEGRISVEEYYFLAHKCRLRFPHYPLAIEQRGAKGHNFYPLEVLSIEAGQRVTDKNRTAAFAEKMLQETRTLPQEMRRNIIRQLRLANLNKGDNKYLISFGVQISGDFVTTDAKLLAAPEIHTNPILCSLIEAVDYTGD
ncbi:hypothetical protein KIN20_033195 [Parelaphostrongylus tenuis]|uniref:PAZ domain-containing protein n=1 Tax=Parelaphostrongylus tenuis TaxID=148309 RepID=A0AAD5R7N5_PARTN|nr:hypothetical protein KIN20_033195 [Parelaphostrongylus tenuis]